MLSRREFFEMAAMGGMPLAPLVLASLPFSRDSDVAGLVGDGTTDNADALERAAAAGGVLLPPGRYRVDRRVQLDGPLAVAPGAVIVASESAEVEICGPVWAGWYRIFAGLGRFRLDPQCAGVEACPQWWGARGDGLNDDTDAIEAAFATRKVVMPPGKYRITRTLVAENSLWVRGFGSSNSPHPARDSWLYYDGPRDNNAAVIRASTVSVGREPTSALSNLKVQRLVLDANRKAGYGLYGAYFTNESEVSELTVRGATQHGLFASKLWYARLERITATENYGCGITIGRQPSGWSRQAQVNGIFIADLRAHRNGLDGRYHENDNPEWGYGIGFYPGSGVLLRGAVSEKNDGPGIVYALGPGASNGIEGFYLEDNAISAHEQGRATRNWGLVVLGHPNARANSIRTGAFGGSVGSATAQAILLTGPRPTGDLILADLAFGEHIRAGWDRFRFEGHVYHGLRQKIEKWPG